MMTDARKKKNKDNLGALVKAARTKEGYTQKALADAVGLEYYTMISQMELGYVSIPASLWVPLADKLKMDEPDWVLRCLGEYYPEIYKALFNGCGRKEVASVLERLKKGELGHERS